MPDEKPTTQIDAVQVLSRLIESVRDEFRDGLRGLRDDIAKLQTSDTHLVDAVSKLETSDKHLANAVGEQAIKLTRLDERLKRVEEERISDRRDLSDDRHAREREQEAFIRHVSSLEGSIARTNEAVGAIVEELGIEDRVELGRQLKPGEAPPVPTLTKLDQRTKSNIWIQVAITLSVIAQIAERILNHH